MDADTMKPSNSRSQPSGADGDTRCSVELHHRVKNQQLLQLPLSHGLLSSTVVGLTLAVPACVHAPTAEEDRSSLHRNVTMAALKTGAGGQAETGVEAV